ncbi:g-type lectin s-receptor-like serine/threonine-protein kinase ces101 [Quercus suber]|uniref:G-type lectin s-receptor-like serine/threonine-protein kinase ces101 n=1 Tax=Quercus suber TaxID=58331 RepID=A0AAW0JPT7_QUESU|nr:G-type lectin S-receptor-like serine/threonine-protein kinase CES101 [Quercus suber]POE58828.1 g-type lectin s-receptor-like serine/threonine-protein kinase [Quercus suber]
MSTNVHLKFLLLLFFSSFLWDSHAQHVPGVIGVAARNSLKPGDTLNSSSSLNSPNGRFMLRFYLWPAAFGTTNYTYLTIFRTSDSRLLTVENNAGSLKIRHHGDNPIELSSSPQPTNNTVAFLLDSGNFVFNEMYSNGSKKRVLWKSFDHPGKVLLPGMKLGVNQKTGQNWSLIAWLTDDYLAPGAFTLEYSGHQLIIRRRGVVYWKSGVLRGNEFENISPKVTSTYHFNVVSNGNEESFSFMCKNGSQESRWLFTSTGQLLGDDPQPIAQADKCDGYNIDGGCQRWNQPLCRHHHQHGYTIELNCGILCPKMIRATISQIQILASVTVKLAVGATVTVWLILLYLQIELDAKFGQIFPTLFQTT